MIMHSKRFEDISLQLHRDGWKWENGKDCDDIDIPDIVWPRAVPRWGVNEKPNTQTVLADVTFIKALTVSKF
jgi:hypothetical protein